MTRQWHDQNNVTAPPANFLSVTPNNSVDLTEHSRAIWVDVAGVVTIDGAESGTNVPFTVPAGRWIPMRVKRIYATGTTATGIKIGY